MSIKHLILYLNIKENVFLMDEKYETNENISDTPSTSDHIVKQNNLSRLLKNTLFFSKIN